MTELEQKEQTVKLAERREVGFDIATVAHLLKAKRASSRADSWPWYILDPRGLKVAVWDGLASIALVFTAVVTPFEVGFLLAPTTAAAPLFILNRIVDGIFIMDMLLQFFLSYRTSDEFAIGMNEEEGDTLPWEFRLRRIAWRYISSGWFFIDLLSIVPMVFDILPVTHPAWKQDVGYGDLSSLKVLRVFRIFRFLKLIRLLRSSRILKRFRVRYTVPRAPIEVGRLFVIVLIVAHFMACILGLVVAVANSPLDTWVFAYGHCYNHTFYVEWLEDHPDVLHEAELLATDPSDGSDGIVCAGPWLRYLVCITWATHLVTGYGEQPREGMYMRFNQKVAPIIATRGVHQLSVAEELVLLCFLFIGAFMWAYVTAMFVDFITTLNPDKVAFRRGMDDLNSYVTFHHIGSKLAIRLREYYQETWEQMRAEARDQIVAKLSPMLRSTVGWEVHKEWLASGATTCFADIDNKGFLTQLALMMEWRVFAPKERPPASFLYIIRKGHAIYGGVTLGPGKAWGQEDALASHFLKDRKLLQNLLNRRAYAISYLHVYCASGDAIVTTLQDAFPKEFAKMKTRTFFRVVCEYILHEGLKRITAERRRKIDAAIARFDRKYPKGRSKLQRSRSDSKLGSILRRSPGRDKRDKQCKMSGTSLNASIRGSCRRLLEASCSISCKRDAKSPGGTRCRTNSNNASQRNTSQRNTSRATSPQGTPPKPLFPTRHQSEPATARRSNGASPSTRRWWGRPPQSAVDADAASAHRSSSRRLASDRAQDAEEVSESVEMSKPKSGSEVSGSHPPSSSQEERPRHSSMDVARPSLP